MLFVFQMDAPKKPIFSVKLDAKKALQGVAPAGGFL